MNRVKSISGALNFTLLDLNSAFDDETVLVETLSRFLGKAQWKFLILTNNHLTALGVRSFAPSLPSSRLLGLYLSNNKLGDEGVQELSLLLGETSLEHIALSSNGITDIGACCLAQVLERCSLVELLLDDNLITNTGVRELCFRAGNAPLRNLDISRNRINSAVVVFIRQAAVLGTNLRIKLEEVDACHRLDIDRCLELPRTFWFGIMLHICATKEFSHVRGSLAGVHLLPVDILRRLAVTMNVTIAEEGEEL